jgi:uncharacterized integral membrane protein
MKASKSLLVVVALIFVALTVVQNPGVFSHEESLHLNLYFKSYQSPPIQLSVYFLGFFLVGFLLAYFHGLSERFKAKGAMKNQVEKVVKLEEEVKALKSLPLKEESPPTQETESS